MLYTSESRALCTTEIAVHTPLGIVPADYQLIIVDIPDEIKISEIKKSTIACRLGPISTSQLHTTDW